MRCDMNKEDFEAGKVILIDKPLEWTSFDVVRKIRNTIGIKKVGHAGTLDPLASGLLIVCTGKFTKKINDYMAQEKEYVGCITLGAVTPTYDLESEPQQVVSELIIDENLVKDTAKKFVGTIDQVPPAHSAIKQKGKPVYLQARKGVDVKLEPRKINIYDFEIVHIDGPNVSFRVRCSTGTYIRSLANDLGAALGCGGYLSALRRTMIGNFNVDEATDIHDFVARFKNIFNKE